MSLLGAVASGEAVPVPEDGLRLHVLGRLELAAPDGTPLLGPGKPFAMLKYLRARSEQ